MVLLRRRAGKPSWRRSFEVVSRHDQAAVRPARVNCTVSLVSPSRHGGAFHVELLLHLLGPLPGHFARLLRPGPSGFHGECLMSARDLLVQSAAGWRSGRARRSTPGGNGRRFTSVMKRSKSRAHRHRTGSVATKRVVRRPARPARHCWRALTTCRSGPAPGLALHGLVLAAHLRHQAALRFALWRLRPAGFAAARVGAYRAVQHQAPETRRRCSSSWLRPFGTAEGCSQRWLPMRSTAVAKDLLKWCRQPRTRPGGPSSVEASAAPAGPGPWRCWQVAAQPVGLAQGVPGMARRVDGFFQAWRVGGQGIICPLRLKR